MRKRLENSTYSLTVEGECEKLYFEHLKKLINTNENRKRNCVFNKILINIFTKLKKYRIKTQNITE